MSDIFNAKEIENQIKTTAFVSLIELKKLDQTFFRLIFIFIDTKKKYKFKTIEPAKHIIIHEN